MKKILLLIVASFSLLLLQAGTYSYSIKPGSLGILINSMNLKKTIVNLELKGKIDARDFTFMRDSMPNLISVDLREVIIVSYNGSEGTAKGTIQYPANAIPINAFAGKTNLVSIKLPTSTNDIQDGAFNNCKNLNSITLSDSVKTIGKNTFNNCISITCIYLSKMITSIGANAFSGDSNVVIFTVTNPAIVDLSNSPYVFKGFNFKNCKLNVPDGTQSQFQLANQWKDFDQNITFNATIVNCTAGNLNTLLTPIQKKTMSILTITGSIDARDFVTLRDSILHLTYLDISNVYILSYSGRAGSDYNSNIINSGNNVEYYANTIPATAFYNLYNDSIPSNLASIILPKDLTTIDVGAFQNTNLTSIQLPKGLVSIYSQAFANTKISEIIFPQSLEHLEGFDNTLLTSVTIPNSVTYLGGFANTKITVITIPSSVTNIGFEAFSQTKIDSITVPSSVKYIDVNAFSSNYIKYLNIKSPILNSSAGAFSGCYNLTSLLLNDSLTSFCSMCSMNSRSSIGSANNIFQRDTSLTSLQLPSKLTGIPQSAFSACHHLNSITIPSTVTSIGSYAFSMCNGLQSIYANNKIPVDFTKGDTISSGGYVSILVFDGVNKNTCILYVPIGSKAAYQAADQWKDFTNIVEVTFVTINHSTLTMFENESLPSSSLVIPKNNQTFTYAIKDTSIVRVNKNGILNSIKTGNTMLYIMNPSDNTVFDSAKVIVLPKMNFKGAVVLRSLSQIEVKVDSDFPLYDKIENDFTISVLGYGPYTVTSVLKSVDSSNTLLLQLNQPLPKKTEITLSYTNTNAVTGVSTVKSSLTILTTGIEQLAMETKLYPNPAQTVVNIEANELQIVSIFNIHGQKVATFQAQGNGVTISVDELPTGVYVAEIITKTENIKKSFVKR